MTPRENFFFMMENPQKAQWLPAEIRPIEPVLDIVEKKMGTRDLVSAFNLPFEDVWRAVADCARWAREGASIVAAPTHVLETDVPWENIEALLEAVKTTRI